ncbi:uncharacterized protein LOC128243807 isoform X1 [Mya arenaria]|uniref:uncharacterized protein LOC128243807 isoform X1 n=2 Tax=Mya arenaria TaxID=6604 RepID=UPI0022E93D47|nr:uncharacterized protein LOC128243807 isoform X1 [Mya arenaria]
MDVRSQMDISIKNKEKFIKMNWSRLRTSGTENVFKGSQLVTSVLERHNQHFRSRAAALKFCRQLFNDGVIRGVFGAGKFEDSVQLYTWSAQHGPNMTSQHGPNITSQHGPNMTSQHGLNMTSQHGQNMTSQHGPNMTSQHGQNMTSFHSDLTTSPSKSYGYSSADITLTKRELYQQKETIRPIDHSVARDSSRNVPYTHDVNNYFREMQNGVGENHGHRVMTSHSQIPSYQTSWNLQRASTASSESSVDILSHAYGKHKDKPTVKTSYTSPSNSHSHSHSRDHDVIPEEGPEDPLPVMERTQTSTEYDGTSSFPRSVNTDTSATNDVETMTSPRRWQQDYQSSYSDNEKQLIEQMRRMKKEHSHILRTYEERINKLMAKMHELRSIAEMLENSSTKSSPYAMINNKTGVLNFLSSKTDHDRKSIGPATGSDGEAPPPLPPRPGRGSRLYPNKPYLQTDAKMTSLPWTRIILKDESGEEQATIWHTMIEPKLDSEEIERLFSVPVASQTDGATLYDDLIIRRGRSRQQLVSIYDTERSQRIVVCMKCLRATLNDVISSVSTLDTSQVNHDGLAELMELLSPSQDIDRILYHVRKKGAGHLDHPEYLVFELSKVDHFRDRLEFIRFRFRLLLHLFEIDQQMRELNTACDEITSSTPLKQLLETVLAVGNYLNGGTECGQADGYGLDVLNKVKELSDRDGKGTLLEFVLKTYCAVYESEVDIGCPTRFRLPEPSNMRHAASVSFEGIQDALSNIHADLKHVREKLLDPAINKDTTRPMDSFRVTAENFFAAALEVIGEQEKVLQDTRDAFDRTTTFFYVDKQHVTPQQFFHVWAVFLHDCKYVWKLAHRRLARERFELEFKYKGQLSACSLQGYGIFRAGVMKGADSIITTDPKTSTAQRNKNNRWADVPENQTRPNVPPKPNRSKNQDETYKPSGGSDRSSSPKPLTSTPPSSVRKPLPQNPNQNGSPPTGFSSFVPPNYENQSEFDRLHQNHSQFHHQHSIPVVSGILNQTPSSVHEHSPPPGSANYRSPDMTSSTNATSRDKKSQSQFSLKTWLRREREQVRKEVEHDSIDQTDSKPQSPSRSFSKFKNTMKQKFSGGSSKKNEASDRKSKDHKTPNSLSNRHATDNPVSPYDILRTNQPSTSAASYKADDQLQNAESGILASLESEFANKPIPDTIISPIDDPDADDILVQDHKHELQNGIPPKIRRDEFYKDTSDMNNNDKFGVNYKPETLREEFPLYGRVQKDHTHRDSYLANSENTFLTPVAESKRIVGMAAPIYKARVINNYENQGKFENPNIPRQQAEPAKPLRNGNLDYTHTNSDVPNNHDVITYPYSRQTTEHTRNRSSDEVLKPKAQQKLVGSNQHFNGEVSAYEHQSRSVASRTPEKNAPAAETPRKRALLGNKNYTTPGKRVPMNVQSIGSLIDKFDKAENNSKTGDNSSNKPDAMTSTPVAHRRNGSNTDSKDMSPPLPPRERNLAPPRSSGQQFTPNENVNDSNMTSRYTSPDNRQPFFSPQSRTENISTNQFSPPSAYPAPQGQTPESQGHFSRQTPKTTPNSQSYGQYTPQLSNGYLPNRDTRNQCSNSRDRVIPNSNGLSNGFHDNGEHDRSDDKDDGYRAKLRKAANFNQSAFDRMPKNSPQYTGRTSFGSPYEVRAGYSYGSTSAMKSPLSNDEDISYMAI